MLHGRAGSPLPAALDPRNPPCGPQRTVGLTSPLVGRAVPCPPPFIPSSSPHGPQRTVGPTSPLAGRAVPCPPPFISSSSLHGPQRTVGPTSPMIRLPLRRGRFTFRLHTLVVSGLGMVAAAILFCFDPAGHAFYPFCGFHRLTGWLCPGCGSLRAMHQLLHGHVATAFRFNSLLLVSLPFLLVWFIRSAARRHHETTNPPRFRAFWVWVFLAVALTFTALRNLPGAPFDLLRP
jgi:hypothetical protein